MFGVTYTTDPDPDWFLHGGIAFLVAAAIVAAACWWGYRRGRW